MFSMVLQSTGTCDLFQVVAGWGGGSGYLSETLSTARKKKVRGGVGFIEMSKTSLFR